MDWKDVSDSWGVRCGNDGNPRYIDENGVRRYVSDNVPIEQEYRPCGACGKYPTESGEDFCFHHLDKVRNACCGHGTEEGYIQFENGVTVRGKFKIEYDNKKLPDKDLDFTDTTFKPTEDKRKLDNWKSYIHYLNMWVQNNNDYKNEGKSPLVYGDWLKQEIEK